MRRQSEQIEKTGAAFSSSMLTDQAVHYDARAEIYDEQNDVPDRVLRRRTVFDIYHGHLRRHIADGSIAYLDFGCGTGAATKEFLTGLQSYCVVRECYAVDVSPGMAKIARQALPGFDVACAGVEGLFRHAGELGLITAFFHVLCHLSEEDVVKCFAGVGRSLARGGRACIDVIKQFEIGEHGYAREDEERGRNYVHYHSFRKDGSMVLAQDGLPLLGTLRMFTRSDIERYARAASLEVEMIFPHRVKNPNPLLGYVDEFAIVLHKV